MDVARFAELSAWLTEAGLAGESETEIVDGFCRRAIDAGLPLARGMVIIDTLHPVHEGRVFRWRSEGEAGHIEAARIRSDGRGRGSRKLAAQPVFLAARDRRLATEKTTRARGKRRNFRPSPRCRTKE